MSEPVKILWSGLTGRIGREAMNLLWKVAGVEVVAGLKRKVTGADDCLLYGEKNVEWMSYRTDVCGLYGLANLAQRAGVDVIVDFSHPDVFDKVLDVAIRAEMPLVSGTSGLSDWQMARLYDATLRIPVFRGGNFRFKVKKFIDEAVELARNTNGILTLYENFYRGKRLPSETSKVVQKRIAEATEKMVEVKSWDTFDKDSLICDWRLIAHHPMVPPNITQGDIHCRTIGFDELAHDVLEIAKVMAVKPVKKGEFYDLDEIWDELPH